MTYDTDHPLRTNHLEHIRLHLLPCAPKERSTTSSRHTTPTMQSAFLAAVLSLLSVASTDAFVPGAARLPARTSASRCGAGEPYY